MIERERERMEEMTAKFQDTLASQKIYELLLDFKAELSRIAQELVSMNQRMRDGHKRLDNHETRLQTLESKNGGMKNEIVLLLVKALVIATSSTAVLCGAGKLLK